MIKISFFGLFIFSFLACLNYLQTQTWNAGEKTFYSHHLASIAENSESLQTDQVQFKKPIPETILDSFLRDLFINTTVGYTLYGQKPISLEGFTLPEKTIPGTKEHFSSVRGVLALKYLKEFVPGSINKKYIFSTNERSSYKEILFINRDSFLRVVKENFILFQYKFGMNMTPESLLEDLTTSDFSAVFKDNIALQGIVLGYGFENAISYEKGSNIVKQLTVANPIPPFQGSHLPKNKAEILCKIKKNLSESNWAALNKEIEDLTHYKKSHSKDLLKIPFSYHKNSAKTKSLIDTYRKDQIKVDSILNKKDFLQQVIHQLGASITPPKRVDSFFTDKEKKNLLSLVARTILETFPDEMSPSFFEGMRTAESQKENLKEGIAFLNILRTDNLAVRSELSQFFRSLILEKNLQCLLPQKLYFRILKEAKNGKELTPYHQSFKARYLFKDMEGKPLLGTYQLEELVELNLRNLISGLAHGLVGMKEGETREIFIHPDFVYGTSSEFGKGKAIQVKIELVELGNEKSTDENLPQLIPFDLIHHAPEIKSCSDFISLQNENDFYCGFKTWAYFKKSLFFSLNEILEQIKKEKLISFTESEKDLLLKFEWSLYNIQ